MMLVIRGPQIRVPEPRLFGLNCRAYPSGRDWAGPQFPSASDRTPIQNDDVRRP